MSEELEIVPNDYRAGKGKVNLPQSAFIGGDITPPLTDTQVALLRKQEESAAIRRQTSKGTEGIYSGVVGEAEQPVKTLDEAFPPRSLETASRSAEFLAKQTGRLFYVIPDSRRPGGFLPIPEADAKRRMITGLAVATFGDPAPEKPAKQARKGVQPRPPDPSADPHFYDEPPDTAPAGDPLPADPIPADPVPAVALINPRTGSPLHFGDGPALSAFCAGELRGGGWGEEVVQLVCAAVAQGIILDSSYFDDVVYTAKAVLYVDRDSPPADLAVFAEAIHYQSKGGMQTYLEALQQEVAELTELSAKAGSETPAALLQSNFAAGRRIIAVTAGLGKELPKAGKQEKPKRSRKKADPKKADPAPPALSPYGIYEIGTPDFGHNIVAIDARQEAIENGVSEEDLIAGGYYKHTEGDAPPAPRCSRCPDPATEEVNTTHFGAEKVCVPCRAALEQDGQIVADATEAATETQADFANDPVTRLAMAAGVNASQEWNKACKEQCACGALICWEAFRDGKRECFSCWNADPFA